jgi:hypothetical protein
VSNKTEIRVGQRVRVNHPKDNRERSGEVERIAFMTERDDIFIKMDSGGYVILSVTPGTKRRKADAGEFSNPQGTDPGGRPDQS